MYIEMRDSVNRNNPASGIDNLDKTPIECSISELKPLIRLEIVSSSDMESLWDNAVRRYHYLGHKRFVGRRLKYIAYAGEKPVAAIGFRSASLKLEAQGIVI